MIYTVEGLIERYKNRKYAEIFIQLPKEMTSAESYFSKLKRNHTHHDQVSEYLKYAKPLLYFIVSGNKPTDPKILSKIQPVIDTLIL